MIVASETDRTEAAPQRHNPILAWLLVLSLILFGGAYSWMASGQFLPLVQAPLILLSVVLAACTGFLYFLNPAQALTYLLLGLLYFSFELTTSAIDTGNGKLIIIKGGLSVIFIFFALFTSSRYVLKAPLTALFALYAAGAALSATYSPVPIFGVVSGLSLLGLSMVTARISQGRTDDVILMWSTIFWASCLTCFMSLALFAISRQAAGDITEVSYRLKGVTGSANALGPMMGLAVITSVFVHQISPAGIKRNLAKVMVVMFTGTLLLTNSRSSIVGMVAGFIGTGLISGGIGIMSLLMVMLGLAAMGSVLINPDLIQGILHFLAANISRTGEVSELTSLTGRSVIWAACVQLIEDRPWLGYGMGSVRIVLPLAYADEWGNTYNSAHNFVLESLISVGWLGTIPLLICMAWALWLLVAWFQKWPKAGKMKHAIQTRDDQVRFWLAQCALRGLLLLLLQGMSEKSFAGQPGSTTLFLCATLATTVYLTRAPEKRGLTPS